jgi:hypothetical protein
MNDQLNRFTKLGVVAIALGIVGVASTANADVRINLQIGPPGYYVPYYYPPGYVPYPPGYYVPPRRGYYGGPYYAPYDYYRYRYYYRPYQVPYYERHRYHPY